MSSSNKIDVPERLKEIYNYVAERRRFAYEEFYKTPTINNEKWGIMDKMGCYFC